MNDLMIDFLYTLFNEGELANLAPQLHHTAVTSPFYFTNPEAFQYMCINPLHDSRTDSNVTAFRSFLVEFDEDTNGNPIPLEDQFAYVQSIDLPYSTATYSGGKSIHFIISLETPLSSADVYAEAVQWLYNIVGSGSVAIKNDHSCRNPSRLSRWPLGTHAGTGRKSDLKEVRGRVANATLMAWLLQHPQHEPRSQPQRTSSGAVKRRSDPIDHEVAVSYLNDKYPLLRGEKQPNLLKWAIFLLANTDMSKDAIADALADNDLGNHRKVSEYERAVDTAFSKLEANS